METKDCCEKCLTEAWPNHWCANALCSCYSKALEITSNKWDLKAPTDEGWVEEMEELPIELSLGEWSILEDFIKSLLQKEREKESEYIAFAFRKGQKIGKSEAFSLVKKAIEESRIKHNHSNRCKIDEPYCIQKEKEVEYTNDVLFSISSKLSTLEGK